MGKVALRGPAGASWLGMLLACGAIACGSDRLVKPLDEAIVPSSPDAPPPVEPTVDPPPPEPDCSDPPFAVPLDPQIVTTTTAPSPVDIVIIVDTSGSMYEEMGGVEANINASLAQALEDAELDYRVILIAKYGRSWASWEDWDDSGICVGPPLGGESCGDGKGDLPPTPSLTEHFYHYSLKIYSNDAWCRVLRSFDGSSPDDYGMAPDGWSHWLREGAHKSFVLFTDDVAECDQWSQEPSPEEMALEFDAALLGLSPQQFGTPERRNYTWHSVVDITAAEAPLTPDDPIVTPSSFGDFWPGEAYQAVSILTEGLRFPVSATADFGAMFASLSSEVIETSSPDCAWSHDELPSEVVGVPSLEVVTPQQTVVWSSVADQEACAGEEFYLTSEQVHLCPLACSRLEDSPEAQLTLVFDPCDD